MTLDMFGAPPMFDPIFVLNMVGALPIIEPHTFPLRQLAQEMLVPLGTVCVPLHAAALGAAAVSLGTRAALAMLLHSMTARDHRRCPIRQPSRPCRCPRTRDGDMIR